MRDRPLLWIAATFTMLLANAAYLAASAEPSLFYFANVALHVVLGIALTVAAVWHLFVRRQTSAPVLQVAFALLAAGALTGLVLTGTGATTPYRRILQAHILSATCGAVLLTFGIATVVRRTADPATRRFARVYAVFVLALVTAAVGTRMTNDRLWQRLHRIDNPSRVPVSMDEEGGGPRGPFFPSSANTNLGGVIPANFFMTSAACGRCHKDVYDQWSSSAHHFSSFNNQ